MSDTVRTDTGGVQEVPDESGPQPRVVLQEYAARAAVARGRPEAHGGHPGDYRVRQDGPRIHEAHAGRSDCSSQSR